jgi:ABC-type branched-subunit amino acid transport system substrate-binding protein
MKKTTWITVLTGLMVLLFIVCYVGIGETQVRGVTKDKIKTGAWIAMSGALAYPGTSFMYSTQAYFDYINDQGGINGRKLEYIAYNDDYEPAKSVAVAKKLIEKDEVFMFVTPMGTGPTAATRPIAQETNTITFLGTGSPMFTNPYNPLYFLTVVNYRDQMTLVVDYLVKEKGFKKIALFGAKGEIGQVTREGAVSRLKKYGLDLIVYDEGGPTDVDVSAQFNKIRGSGAEAVIISATPKPATLMLQEMQKNNWKPVTFIYGPITDQVPGMAKESAEGVLCVQMYPPPEANLPEIQKHREITMKYAKKDINVYTIWAYVNNKITVEILKRLGNNISTENFIKEAEKLRNWDTGLGLKLTFSPTSHDGSKMCYFSIVKEGKLEKFRDWMEIKD